MPSGCGDVNCSYPIQEMKNLVFEKLDKLEILLDVCVCVCVETWESNHVDATL